MPKQTFPTRAERRRLFAELRELERSQGGALTGSEPYQNFTKALRALDEKMEQLCELGPMGLPPAVTAKDRDALCQLLREAGSCGEQFLNLVRFEELDLNVGIPRVVDQLQGMLAGDYQFLLRYDPAARPFSLPVMQEAVRTRTVNLKGHSIQTLGHAQSSRIPMTLRGPNGETRSGVFTKASYVRVKAPFLEILDRAKNQCGAEGAAELDSLLAKARKYHVSRPTRKLDGSLIGDSVSDDFMCGFILNELKLRRKQSKSKKVRTEHVRDYLKRIGVRVDRLSRKALQTLTDGLGKMAERPGNALNTVGLELTDGQRLDNRNTAMSAVADLLGVGSLVARSRNMRFVDESGQVIEGSFMDYGKGLDLTADERSARHLNSDPLSNPETRSRALRAIADLQVLDAICLNVDRHWGNVMYRVDAQGNLIGVQGIDNDSSFGPRELNSRGMENLRVVSRSMADKIRALARNPELLKFTLRGRGLSDDEVCAAEQRLLALDGNITTKILKTVPDKDFYKLKEADYLPADGSANLFRHVVQRVKKSVQSQRRLGLRFESLKSEEAPHLTGVSETGRKHTVGGLADLRNRVSLLLQNEKTDFKVEDLTGVRGSSPEFEKMVEAARLVEHVGDFLTQQGVETKGRNGLLLDDPKAEKIVKLYNSAFLDLRKKTLDYLEKKQEDRKAASLEELKGKNAYEQKRIDYAGKLLAVTDDYLELRDKPLTEEERVERRRLMEQRSLEGRLEFRRDFQNGAKPAVDRKSLEKARADAVTATPQNELRIMK